MRGEKFKVMSISFYPVGSSPHARGKGIWPPSNNFTFRIIPACAGKSFSCVLLHTQKQDHPRMRGEKQRLITLQTQRLGSSPHARGKVYVSRTSTCAERIIPACAGKRNHRQPYMDDGKDHPRMRGEKDCAEINEMHVGGSSPHARGKARADVEKELEGRIIPACAGKSCWGSKLRP